MADMALLQAAAGGAEADVMAGLRAAMLAEAT
jgi:hypothetical protein